MSRGTVSIEAALLIPVFVLVAAMSTAGWRVWWASSQVQSAAQSGARVAAQSVTVDQAHQRVVQVVTADLTTASLHCQGMDIREDLSAVALPPGVAGQVWVRVSCTVGLADLLVPGLPGTISVTGAATESVDLFRSRPR